MVHFVVNHIEQQIYSATSTTRSLGEPTCSCQVTLTSCPTDSITAGTDLMVPTYLPPPVNQNQKEGHITDICPH